MQRIAGVDEAGRGPLAGPVVAAAVILAEPISGLNDSKKLTEKQRNRLFPIIQNEALAWSIGIASVEEIDRMNILQATLLAMQRAVSQLSLVPEKVLVDGNQAPKLTIPVQTIIGGDASEPTISAASVIAKVTRDTMMLALDQHYPQYGFKQHKGYGTKAHLAALAKYGVSPSHRKSFAPVAKCLSVCE